MGLQGLKRLSVWANQGFSELGMCIKSEQYMGNVGGRSVEPYKEDDKFLEHTSVSLHGPSNS